MVVFSLALAVRSSFLPNIFAIRNIAYYLFYFLLGYLFHSKKNIIHKTIKHMQIPILILGVLVINLKVLYMDGIIWDIIVAIMGILGCYVVGTNVKRDFYNKKLYKMIQKNSFGIYLIHPMIIYVLFYFFRTANPYLFCVEVLMVTLVISYLSTEIFRKIKLKWVLGEG